jgi:hypothetical protein
MRNRSRALREAVIHAMAMVGLVWALAVLGALFMAMSSLGQHHDGGYSLSAADPHAHHSFPVSRDAPRTAGLVLTLLVLGGGATVLVVGATLPGRGDGRADEREHAEPEAAADLPLVLGLCLLA